MIGSEAERKSKQTDRGAKHRRRQSAAAKWGGAICTVLIAGLIVHVAAEWNLELKRSGATTASSPSRKPMNQTAAPGRVPRGPLIQSAVPQRAHSIALVPYRGPVQHIFFHPLIAYPARAFSSSNPEERGYNDWMITVGEFNRMLAALYQDGFILINVEDLYSEVRRQGKVFIQPRPLRLPRGKKPLILSIDDMNYYPYMIRDGNVSKLVVAHGHIATVSTSMQGRRVVSTTNEIVPILDHFVALHPDFSFQGQKGMINLTGYAGVLGYRTNERRSPHFRLIRRQAETVIQFLKRDGWTFASHGWGHLDAHAISYATFVADTNRWLKEVEPLTGPTPVYVYPFGSRIATGGAKFQYLVSKGFHVFCSVGPTTYIQWTPQVLMMDRRHMDGIALHEEPQTLRDLFNARTIISKRRPKLY